MSSNSIRFTSLQFLISFYLLFFPRTASFYFLKPTWFFLYQLIWYLKKLYFACTLTHFYKSKKNSLIFSLFLLHYYAVMDYMTALSA